MSAPLSPHPTADTLRAFGSGQLDDTAAEAVVAHIDVCPPCRASAASLSGDSFLMRLRAVQGRRATPPPGKSQPPTISYHASQQANPPPVLRGAGLPPELCNHDQYEVLRELGRGGMGVVYLAKNKLMGRPEVLKVVNRDLLDNPDATARFLREIRSAAHLSHPNIVTAYAALPLGGSMALAMEYIDGENLARVVANHGPLPVANACYYTAQVAMGLQHAFEKGMIHRDIKPHNLILARDSKKHVVKILDFGLAKATQANGAVSLSVSGLNRKLTKFGTVMGTPEYIAPEQIRDAASADIRADLYSLGCTLYFLLAGHTPFPGRNMDALLAAHLTETARPVNEVRPEVPGEVAAVVARLLAKEPGKRYQKPAEVAQALAPFCKAGLKPLRPGAMAAGGKEVGSASPGVSTKGGKSKAGSGTLPGGDAAKNPNRGQQAGAPVPVLRQTVIERVPTSARGSKHEPGGRDRSARRKAAMLWLIVGGCVALLVACVVWLWSADKTPEATPPSNATASIKEPVPEKGTSPNQSIKDGGGAPPKESVPVKVPDKEKNAGLPPPKKGDKQPDPQKVKAPPEVQKDKKLEAPPLPVAPFNPQKAKELQEAWAKYQGRKVIETVTLGDGVQIVVVLIPPSNFAMGSPKEKGLSFEGLWPVTITKPFYLGKHEVTKGAFARFVAATGYRTDAEKDGQGGRGLDATGQWSKKPEYTWRNPGWEQTDKHPVVNVSWNDAVAFCKWLSKKEGKQYRLPTEAEWELSCSAGSTTRYHNGDDDQSLVKVANVADASAKRKFPNWTWAIQGDDGYVFTAPVGQFTANPFGLHDMHGNVQEWCQDWFGGAYYLINQHEDPQGPSGGTNRVIRGGSFDSFSRFCGSGFRGRIVPSFRSGKIGFRVVCER